MLKVQEWKGLNRLWATPNGALLKLMAFEEGGLSEKLKDENEPLMIANTVLTDYRPLIKEKDYW